MSSSNTRSVPSGPNDRKPESSGRGNWLRWVRDVLFVMSIGVVPIIFKAEHSLGAEHGILWATILLSIFAPLYRNRLVRFLALVPVGWIAAIVYASVDPEFSDGAGLVALFVLPIIVPATVIAAMGYKFYDLGVTLLMRSPVVPSLVWWAGVAIAMAWSWQAYQSETRILDKVDFEMSKREELLTYAGEALGRDSGADSVGEDHLEQLRGHAKSIYGVAPDSESILHGYGGLVVIQSEGPVVSIEYQGIPAGEACYKMYALKNLYFDNTFVDGNSTDSNGTGHDMNRIRRELCFTDERPVTVRFEERLPELIRKYGIFRPRAQ